MSDLVHEAELQRLARVLGTGTGDLTSLAAAAPEDLRALRETIAEHLHDRHAHAFGRAIAVASKLPGAMTAKLAEHAMGPVLTARAATLLEPAQAADLAKRLPPLFLADVATHLDLRRAGPLVAGIPVKVLAEAGEELRRREEWVVLGAFVGHVGGDDLAELLAGFDGEALLRASTFVDPPSQLDAVIAALPDARLGELVAAAEEHGLRDLLDGMLASVSSTQSARLTAA